MARSAVLRTVRFWWNRFGPTFAAEIHIWEFLHDISQRLQPTLVRAQHALIDQVLPALAARDVRVVHYDSLRADERDIWDERDPSMRPTE